MIKIRASDIRQMKESEFEAKLKELSKELLKMNSQIATHTPPENPGKVKQVKKTISRMLTILHEKKKESKSAVKEQKGVISKK